MIKLLAILMLTAPGCAHMTYDRAQTVTVMEVGTNTVVTTNIMVGITWWSLFKDYTVAGSNAVLGAGSVSSDTDSDSLEGVARGAAEGAMKGALPTP